MLNYTKIRTRNLLLASFILFSPFFAFSQAFKEYSIGVTCNIGAPHLYKGILKLSTQSDKFKKTFNGKLEVFGFRGMYPIALKGEWGLTKYIGIGLSGSVWNISFNVKDNYNVLHAGQVTGTDEIDIYKFKITSTSFGIRPNLHIPLQDSENDFYLGIGLGFTKNKLGIDFSSTDVNKVFPDAKYELSLPGFVYFAPSIGYKHYFNKFIGTNVELAYEKGAILQVGLALRFNYKDE